MTTYRFADVEVLLADAQATKHDMMRGKLAHAGFTKTRVVSQFKELAAELEETAPDLLIFDADFAEGDVCGLCRSLRNHRVGRNPFVPVIDLTSNPTEGLVRSIIDSGVDDLLTKPVSTAGLLERIKKLIEDRKLFVVTSDYVGPNRRANGRSVSATPLLDVPNVLRARAIGDTKALDRLEDDIRAALAQVNQQKMERHAYKVVYLATVISRVYEERQVRGTLITYLDELIAVARDLAARLANSGDPAVGPAVGPDCARLIVVAKRIHGSVRVPKAEDVALLVPRAREIHDAFNPEMSEARFERELVHSVEQHLMRAANGR